MRSLSDQLVAPKPLPELLGPTDWVTCPHWLVPGALVLVLSGTRKSDVVATHRVVAVEFPWLVWLEGSPGATHARNVLSLAR